MLLITAGKLRALAVTSAARAGILPEVPTIGEYVPDYEASGWTGVCAPGRTPPAVIGTLNAAINAGLTDAGILNDSNSARAPCPVPRESLGSS